jgi:hypothetical protein
MPGTLVRGLFRISAPERQILEIKEKYEKGWLTADHFHVNNIDQDWKYHSIRWMYIPLQLYCVDG